MVRGASVPSVYDNIEHHLAPALKEALVGARSVDFCVGYFNLRGWRELGPSIEALPEGATPCRLLIGMYQPPSELRRALHGINPSDGGVDNKQLVMLRQRVVEEFRDQLASGVPTRADEAALRMLGRQLREGRLRVKLNADRTLHAKLYLVHRRDAVSPRKAFVGSSNLTFSGLQGQGELNVGLLDEDATEKLARWFDDRWTWRFSVDVSNELAAVLDESWVAERLVPPFHVYLKIAWHLSRDARAGLAEFQIPPDLDGRLFDYQRAAVKIAAHHVNTRGGVMLGDVVGLGKTLMATAVARVLEDDLGWSTLILCPSPLVSMWEQHRERHRLHARVVSLSRAQKVLPSLRRYQLVVIDESHNLRNREGKRYRAIADYVRRNESRCVLLTATPYNKSYLDLGSQLRLFVPDDRDLGIRPEALIREMGEGEFRARHQCPPRSLAAFEKSDHVDDWRDLMRLYLVRRTRSFIRRHYAAADPETGRRYLTLQDGSRAWFPDRVPKTLRFDLDEASATDRYARLYADEVVRTLVGLLLPRYGLGNYLKSGADQSATPEERTVLTGLSKAGRRLQGFCRTNLFKRLESSGSAFLRSVERHVVRNHVFLHALSRGEDLPIGPQEAELLDDSSEASDGDAPELFARDEEGAPEREPAETSPASSLEARARRAYEAYKTEHVRRFKWLSPALFKRDLATALKRDNAALQGILDRAGDWDADEDRKLSALHALLTVAHAREKVLIFTQFADTAEYLADELRARGVADLGCVTGRTKDPTSFARRFSPRSNEVSPPPEDELRVLVATDLLSEGQNLQDCALVVNYDLPWAVIRLVQRAGRVDRIGQRSPVIRCYSFLPSAGVERLINLRGRMRQRLQENAEVVGTDEAFFDDDDAREIVDLYNEKAGILDGKDDADVDLASLALQIWKDSIAADPALEKVIPRMAPVLYATRAARAGDSRPPGTLVFVRTAHDTDALAYVDEAGRSLTESQFEILRLAECRADTPALPPRDEHHALVEKAVGHILAEEETDGGALGPRTGARSRVYERLKRVAENDRGTLFENRALVTVIDELFRNPLQATASEALSRQLRAGIDDRTLAESVLLLRDAGRLCYSPGAGDGAPREPVVVCSMGVV